MDNTNLQQNENPKRNSRKSQLDKICSKLQLSIVKNPINPQISKSLSLKIQRYIKNDNINQLQSLLNSKAIPYNQQIGFTNNKWNIVHFMAKNNSKKLLSYILSKKYQQSKQDFLQLVNVKTSQGYTPLMIAIIHSSTDIIQIMLNYGGIVLSEKDYRNMTAYEIALNYKNQKAIKSLMKYETITKKKMGKSQTVYINEEQLQKPLIYQGMNPKCHTRLFEYLVDCFICFKGIQQQELMNSPNTNTKSKEIQHRSRSRFQQTFNNNIIKSLLHIMEEKNQIDIVSIGNKNIQQRYQIQWKKISSNLNQKNDLFDSFQPFDICQNNLIIANNLIIFQCLSDHTWLLRKIIKPIKKVDFQAQSDNPSKSSLEYVIELYVNDELKKITIDQYIPFLKQRDEPIFLSNLNQTWPQLLQKGLAKIHGDYMKLSQISPRNFIENLTGNYTKRFTLKEGSNYFYSANEMIKQKSIISILQQFNTKGYMILLEGRQGTSLAPKKNSSSFKNYCYTILNYYQKNSKKLILINCPYVLNTWKEKEKHQTIQLKLIKSHYNMHNQMCVWIEQNQFANHFKSVIVSFTQPNLIRSQLKMKFIADIKEEDPLPSRSSNLQKIGSVLGNITNSFKQIVMDSKQDRTSIFKFDEEKRISALQRVNEQNLVNKKSIKKSIFIKFTIQKSRKQEYFSLAIKNNKNREFCKISKISGWINGGIYELNAENYPYCLDLIKIQQKKGEYFCKIQIEQAQFTKKSQTQTELSVIKSQSTQKKRNDDNKENQNTEPKAIQIEKNNKKYELLAIFWAQDPIQLQHIEEQFALLEWIQSWRKNSMKNWTFLQKSSTKYSSIHYITEFIEDKIIILTKSIKDVNLYLMFSQSSKLIESESNYIIQGTGKKISQIKSNDKNVQENDEITSAVIQFIRDPEHQEFQYIVLGSNKEIVKALRKGSFQIDHSK